MLSAHPPFLGEGYPLMYVRAGAHRRKLGFSARHLKSGFTRGWVVSKAKGVLM